MKSDQPAKALFRLGTLLTFQQQPAIETLKHAIRQGQGVQLADRWVGGAHLYLAYAYNSAGDFQQAINTAESGELLANRAKDKSLLTKLLQEKIIALDELGQYEAAHQAAERGLTLAKQEGYPLVIARAYQVLGGIAEKQNRLNEALQYTLRALAIARAENDVAAPNYSVTIGMLYTQLHQYDKAVSYFQYGVDQNTNGYDKAYALAMLGQVYAQKKEYEKALRYYQQGLIMMPVGFRNASLTRLPDPQAIQLADQKEYLLTLIRSKADAWLDYARATGNNRQRLNYALETYQVADKMIDFMRREHTEDQSKLYWRQKTRGIYERAIETSFLLNNAEQAFRFLEKSRAVMLADKLNELGARQKLSQQQLDQEEKLKQSVSLQQNSLAEVKPDESAAYSSARMALFTKQDSLNAFLKRLEVSNPAYYAYKYDTTTTSLANLQRYLKRQQASFVTYFVGDSALYVLGVTPDKATFYRRPLRTYQQDVQTFLILLADSDTMNSRSGRNRFLALGNGLYKQLLAPLNLSAGRVIVSPDGGIIPFETFSRQAVSPAYLVKEYAFSYVYSARLLLKKKTDRSGTTGSRDFLGLAPVAFASSLKQDSLPDSDRSLERIAARFHSPELLLRKAATRRAFLTKAAEARVIQLFTHAAADSSAQEPTLYFADSTLRLSDLNDGDLSSVQMVVLAACKTGIGTNQRGEGVFSLARGFSALGVPSVFTTLWSVQDRATYGLTELFYQHIDEGLPKDVALQRAKQDWLNTKDGENLSPTFWAGLITVGDAEPLAKPVYGWWIGGTLFVLLAGLGGWLFWHKRRHLSMVAS